MPLAGKRWRHVIINTHSTWHHGDPRGFRSRGHRIHSSSDYRNPPPAGEHAGLHRYREKNSRPEVHLDRSLWPVIGRAVIDYFRTEDHRLLAVAVTYVHSHLLVELPNHVRSIKQIIGHAKRKSSRAVKHALPGSVWSAGGKYKPVDTRSHLKSAMEYILYNQGNDAWTWSFKDRSLEGQFGRKRPTHK